MTNSRGLPATLVLCAIAVTASVEAQQIPKSLLEARARRELEEQRKKEEAERAKAEAAPIRIAPDRKTDVPDLKKILNEWGQRAKKSLEQLNTYPQPDKKTASLYMGVIDDQIIAMLGTRVDPDPEIDAYLKLQMFYFRPNFRAVNEQQFVAMIEAMPAPAEVKNVPASMLKLFERSERKALDAKLADSLYEKWQSMQPSKKEDQAAAYRAKLTEVLPRTNGMRFCASFQDFYNRYGAGDVSCLEKKSKEQLLVDAEAAWKLGDAFSPAGRQHLKKLLKRLQSMARDRRTVERVVDVQKAGEGKFKLTRLGPPLAEPQLQKLEQFITTSPKSSASGA